MSYRVWKALSYLSIGLFVAACVWAVGILYTVEQVSSATHLPVNSLQPQQSNHLTPTRIQLPSIATDLEVVAGVYDHTANTWSIRGGAANFATIGHTPAEQRGVVLIYAHDRDNAFGRLSQLSDGARATVIDTTGEHYLYQLDRTKTREYAPHDTSLLDQLDGNPRLILMTCTGWLSDRRITYEFTRVKTDE